MIDIGTGWFVGALLGMRHALEPDHLAAVSTLLPGERGLQRRALLGASWGVGHTLSLLFAVFALSVLSTPAPPWLADLFELVVALMLVALGFGALRRAHRDGRRGPVHRHVHGQTHHAHAAPLGHVHLGRLTLARRPLLIGFVHGLAGSGALTALVLCGLPSALSRLGYVLLFGAGSIIGMAFMTGLCGFPLSRLGRRPGALRALSATAGAFSAVLGIFWGYPLASRLLAL